MVAVALVLTCCRARAPGPGSPRPAGADPVGRHVSVPTYAPPSRSGLMPSPEAGSLMIDAAVRAADTRSAGADAMADDFDPVSNGRADSPERGHVGSQDGLREPMPAIRLLIGYGNALDSIAAKRSIVFLPHCSVSPGSPGPCKVLPRVNRMAALLAEAHVAARVDTLLRKGRRSRALDPQGDSQLDLERLQNFRDSLSPAGWKTLALWVILFALAIAFPVATITDYLRTLVPRIIVCSSTYSFAAMSESLSRSSQQPLRQVLYAGINRWPCRMPFGRAQSGLGVR